MTPAELAPRSGPGGQAQGACEALGVRIDALMRQSGWVRATVTPPRCEMNAQAQASCQGSCSADVDPGEIVARCDPARLSGYCQGRCEGRCSGQCQGTCSAVDARGNCAGSCAGQCYGTCDATCHARCEGSWQAPRCEGYVRPPSADAECDASCRAHANINATCTPAAVALSTGGNTDMALRLATTMRANLPLLIHAETALGRRLAADAQVLGQVGAQLPRIVGDAGARAVACIGAAADVTARASMSIRVSVQASASVTGKVGASGG
jgi:hypothetical protein